jgi:hypothetical protein
MAQCLRGRYITTAAEQEARFVIWLSLSEPVPAATG